ncbi:uncharacterized protein LOC133298194 [Gastrolobium bilobum]|uniref:uncharacterized protein LOC133298194 n=1 Tax=Gastrolobium bilobum TaxID=150636 RepID=UPI002AB1A19D|nr:uncharacterized protein LOC133298194 [Gastrolobium bilobum]
MAIITRSGKVVAPLKTPILDCAKEDEKHDGAVEPEVEVAERPVVVEKEHELSHEYVRSKAPYPERFKKEAYNKQYGRFLDIFKKLHINIPFAEALASMPGYSKFMKDLLSRKHKLQECQTVTLTEKCSAFIQQKIPAKLSDPGSFNIPIAIGNICIGRALCDLGASINLMPLSVYKSLGIEELKPTAVSLQLADRSVRTPNGIIEDVLVKVDKFIFPADFVVLDMEEGSGKPLLLGRPFLATARALIDVEQGMIKLRMNNEEITYNVSEAMKRPAEHSDCFQIDVFQEIVQQKKVSPQEIDYELRACEHMPFEKKEVAVEVLKEKIDDIDVGAPKVELKILPNTLKYVFLGDEETYPVIINKGLSSDQEKKLVEVLKTHKTTIGWSISDLKGISPSVCTHKILSKMTSNL